MIEKIAQDIETLANIKLAGIANLFEKIAANSFGVTKHNFISNMLGNAEVQNAFGRNLPNMSMETAQKLHTLINTPGNSALRRLFEKNNWTGTLTNILQNNRRPAVKPQAVVQPPRPQVRPQPVYQQPRYQQPAQAGYRQAYY
jgi:hypothetical protein